MTRAFVFPGQGSQTVGMGKELADAFPAAKAVFNEVDDTLGQNLSSIMFKGPDEDLVLTENTQPALLACSIAVLRVLESEGGFKIADHGQFVAGHSLGEYSALCAAGTFSLSDAVKLVKIRGKAMQIAVPLGEGAMAALIGLEALDAEAVVEEAAQGDVCDFANDNASGQVVVSGATAAVERALVIAKEHGAKRALLLPVSAPFHCAMMQPAADVMAGALGDTQMNDPIIPLIANVTAQEVTTANEARELLIKQVCGRVRWREGALYMKSQGVSELVEIGHGKVLSGMAKRIDKELSGRAIGSAETIEKFLKTLE
ncbi:MAG: ACP S-malonyltransferase [Rhodospirillales bacterium]|jgi:[acyl-carrier-protein] S-malonyltransferase|tara:strand:+ start:670 stop:1614 length:945 start_codon:yes stop_codon:yes gene_type:complete